MDFDFDTSTISSILVLDPGSGTLTVDGTSGIIVPIGNTSERLPGIGVLRYNTDITNFEGNIGAKWVTFQEGNVALSNLVALAGTGTIVQTGVGTYATRTITGTAGTITVSNGSGVSGNPTINLDTAGTSGTGYVSINTDSYGRVTYGNTVQSWTTIVDTPTTVAGYGITDVITANNTVFNYGGIVGFNANTYANIPAAGSVGNIFIATDTLTSYYDNGVSWDIMFPALTGDVSTLAGNLQTTLATVNSTPGAFGNATTVPTFVVNGKGLVTAAANVTIPNSLTFSTDVTGSGTVGSTTALTLATVNANVGTFGSTTQIPVITVNGKGLITAVTTDTVFIPSANIILDGDVTAIGTTGANTTVTLNTVNGTTGAFGSSTSVGTFIVNGKGLVTSAANVSIPLAVTIDGDASGVGTTSSNTTITLNTVNSNVGFFGANNKVATFTVNGKGLLTQVANVTITPEAIGAVNVNQLAVANGVATLGPGGTLTSSQIPPELLGAVVYQGTWDAFTNSPTITSGVGTTGYYYIVSVDGTTTVDGHSTWQVGDMIIYNGTTWDAIDGSPTEVSSVFGRVGAVTANLDSADFYNQGSAVTVLHGNVAGNPFFGPVDLSTDITGTLPNTSFPALTGDVTTIAGNVNTTLATVNGTVGTFGGSTIVGQFTVNGKGLITSAANVTIPTSLTFSTDVTGSGTVGSTTALTLATVNSNVGAFGSTTNIPTFVVNGKGLITAAANVAISYQAPLQNYTENPSSPTASTVTGLNSVSIGSGNTVSGNVAIATGLAASTAVYGAEVHANGSFTAAGDAQTGKYVLRAITNNTAAATEVFLDGSAARIVLRDNSAIAYKALIVGRTTSSTGSYAAFEISGLIKRDSGAGSTALVGTRTKSILTRPTGFWDAEVAATGGALTFTVSGVATDITRWVVTVTTSEVVN